MRLQVPNVLALSLLFLAVVEFVARGPIRAVRGSEWTDFLSPYVQSRAWIHGADPYRDSSLLRFWPPAQEIPEFIQLDIANGRLAANRGMPSPYPLTAFVLLAPIAALPWTFARFLWLGINLIAFVLMLRLIVSLGVRTGEIGAPRYSLPLRLRSLHSIRDWQRRILSCLWWRFAWPQFGWRSTTGCWLPE